MSSKNISRDPSLHYTYFTSRELSGDLECGLDVSRDGTEISLAEVWAGGINLQLHLSNVALEAVEREAIAAFRGQVEEEVQAMLEARAAAQLAERMFGAYARSVERMRTMLGVGERA